MGVVEKAKGPLRLFTVEYQNTRFQFRTMPFGLSFAPRIFTGLIAHVTKMAAERGIFMLAYFDDLLVFAPTFLQCQWQLRIIMEILENLVGL